MASRTGQRTPNASIQTPVPTEVRRFPQDITAQLRKDLAYDQYDAGSARTRREPVGEPADMGHLAGKWPTESATTSPDEADQTTREAAARAVPP
jgi:hypothetical protein